MVLTGLSVSAGAQQRATLADIDYKINQLNEFYGDVPSAIECGKPRTRAEELICADAFLRRAELLNSKAEAYAIENATKSELDHTRFVGHLPVRCTDKQCVYRYFENQTNKNLGGESPYKRGMSQ
jgi:uncharacterized protein